MYHPNGFHHLPRVIFFHTESTEFHFCMFHSFKIAKEALISTYRTERTTKSAVLEAYEKAEKLGLDYDINRDVYAKVMNYTIDDVVKFQQEVIKGRKFRTVILGRESDIDMKALEKFGKVTVVPVEELFGY